EVPPVPSKKFHDVVVVRKRAVAGYPQLLARLENAYKGKSMGERRAQAFAMQALAQFLVDNGAGGPVPVWLLNSASALSDIDHGKSLPSNIWRKFALISLGMKALTMGGVKREDAAVRACRAVKTIGKIKAETLLHRYDELQKGRVKNREARHIFNTQREKLAEFAKRDGFEAVAKHYFGLADQMEV